MCFVHKAQHSTPIRGKNGLALRIVSAYRPSNKISKGNTTYSQHIRFFNRISRDGCPQQLFWDDLFAQLDAWKKAGELIVLAVDANQDIRNGALSAAMRHRGIGEVMVGRHGDDLPPTCSGSKPIDGIFASNEVRITKCGYLGFGEAVFSDHRALWVDIDSSILCDGRPQLAMHVSARRLTLANPKTKTKYLELWAQFAATHKLADRIAELRMEPSTRLTKAQQIEYEKIDQLRTEGEKFAERRCRKLRKGQIPFSPQLKLAAAKVDLYRLTIKWKKGGRVSSRKMERLSKNCKVNGYKALPLDELNTRFKSAREMYNITKSNAPEMRRQFLRDLADARAAEHDTKASSEIKSILVQEEIRSSFRRINHARGKQRAVGVSFITYTDQSGQKRETHHREKVELEIMRNNQKKITKNHATPPYGGTLLGHLGKLGGGKYVQQILDGEYVCPPQP